MIMGKSPIGHEKDSVIDDGVVTNDDVFEKESINGSRGKKTAITFEGGGFSSVAIQTAVITGILSTMDDKTLVGSKLLDKFEILSSVSGGSWFISSLIYSGFSVSLIQRMAAKPSTACSLFNDEYFTPLLEYANEKVEESSELLKIMKMFPDFSDTLFGLKDSKTFLDLLVSKGGWREFISTVLSSTTGKDITTTLKAGHPSQEWAKGKTWLCCHSVIAPTPKSMTGSAIMYVRDDYGIADAEGYYYSLEIDQTGISHFPQFLPAKFSLSLNGDPSLPAPYSYMASTVTSLITHGKFETSYFDTDSTYANTPDYEKFDAFMDQIGQIPVHDIVACSSAAAAGIIVHHAEEDAAEAITGFEVGANLGPQLACWAALTPDSSGTPFNVAATIQDPIWRKDQPVTKEQNEIIANASIIPLGDGGLSENAGIAHTVSLGATEVTSFVSWHSLKLLFNGVAESMKDIPTDKGNQCFTITGVTGFSCYQIFKFKDLPNGKSAYDFAKEKIETFMILTEKIEGITDAIRVGSLDVVTVDNMWFDIKKGQNVKLQLIMGGTTDTLGVGAGIYVNKFGRAIQHIVTGIAKAQNERPEAFELVKSFFL